MSLIVDAKGVVLDVAFADAELAKAAYRDWVGRRWIDTVTEDTRPKIEDLLREANARQPTRWRQVNHPAAEGPDVPVRYCAMRFGPEKRIVAVGRDLRALAALQQRLAEAQQAMEREYARIRNAEKRYRLLFQLSSEPVAIVDAAEPARRRGQSRRRGAVRRRGAPHPGAHFVDLFDAGQPAGDPVLHRRRPRRAARRQRAGRTRRRTARACCSRARCFVRTARRS